jgi:RNA polymerase sigma factor (sigma-70 family)
MTRTNPASDEAATGHVPSDGSLLRRIKRGEEAAATELYLRYSKRLLALAKANTAPELAVRFDPEDVVQSVFRSFFRRASTGCYEVPEGGELWRLLLVHAINKVRQLAIRHRAQRRDAGRTISYHGIEEEMDGRYVNHTEPLQILEFVIDDLLSTMTTAQKRIVELRIEGHTVDEIAEQTRRSKRTVERVLQSFREQLAELIADRQDGK